MKGVPSTEAILEEPRLAMQRCKTRWHGAELLDFEKCVEDRETCQPVPLPQRPQKIEQVSWRYLDKHPKLCG